MENTQRLKDYDNIYKNNKLIAILYNRLITLEKEGLLFSDEYFSNIELIKKYKDANKDIYDKYPLADCEMGDYLDLINPDKEKYDNGYNEDDENNDDNYEDDDDYDYESMKDCNLDEYDKFDDEYNAYEDDVDEDEEVIYNCDKDNLDEVLSNTEGNELSVCRDIDNCTLDIEYSIKDEDSFKRFYNDVQYYYALSKEINNNYLYAGLKAHVGGCLSIRDVAIYYLHNSKGISLSEAEAKVDEKLDKKLSDNSRITRMIGITKEKLIELYKVGYRTHSIMYYLLDSINNCNNQKVKDILIARKYYLIFNNKCLEESFLNNPRNFVNVQAYKRLLTTMYDNEDLRKEQFTNWDESYLNLIEATAASFVEYENCDDDEECIAHNIHMKTLIQAYTSMLFDKGDVKKALDFEDKVVKTATEKSTIKVITDSKKLTKKLLLSEN